MYLLTNNLQSQLINLQSSNELTEFISNEIFLTDLPINISIESSIAILGVEFQSIQDATQEQVDLIIKLSAYKMNLANFVKIFNKNMINMEVLKGIEEVSQYVSSNLEEFLNNVILEQDIYDEDEEIFKELLQKDISINIKKRLVQKWSGYIHNLMEIDDVFLLQIFYENVAFEMTWSNIIYCRQILKTENKEFIINNLFRDEEKWQQFINNSGHTEQDELSDSEYQDYNLLINLLLESNEIEKTKLQEFVSLIRWMVDIDNPDVISAYAYKLLIKVGALRWDEVVYNVIFEIGDSEMQIEYLINEFKNSKESIQVLNADSRLPWSKKLLEKLHEFSRDIMYQYLIKHVNELNEAKFNEILNLNVLGFNESFFTELVKDNNQGKLINYLKYILDPEKNFELTNVLSLIQVNSIIWDSDLFNYIKVANQKVAIKYLMHHEESLADILNEIEINSQLFNYILQEITTMELKLKLINNNITYGIEFDEELASVVLECIREDESAAFELITPELLESQLIPLLEDENDLVKVVRGYITYGEFEKEAIFNLLSKSKNPFNRIKRGGGNGVEFEKNDDSKLLFKRLKEMNVISSYTESEVSLRVNNKQNSR
ncbi:hypothetical protein PB01_17380 [Psychrobacillus glaciei]|uniref:Uncharacterized protein n=1 Tax=Psychrobacillus glaciei TaxID=2283160 RepID=A0A5J6SR63_9BACI|nr:hypothetical protein [Psychrobacillus glaciei]QFG00431.1 hypothetical protein PB01_17380 [Psychrobacillus glaciei]